MAMAGCLTLTVNYLLAIKVKVVACSCIMPFAWWYHDLEGVHPVAYNLDKATRSSCDLCREKSVLLQVLFVYYPCLLWSQGSGFHRRLSVRLFFHMMSQKPMQLGSPNLTYKCPGSPFILGEKVKVARHKNSVGVGLCTLVSAGFFLTLPG